jgi:hypothetical protein
VTATTPARAGRICFVKVLIEQSPGFAWRLGTLQRCKRPALG